MKKDVLSAWLRELCTIVFTQTLQAFLLAIMMSMVLKALVKADISKDNAALEASGLFCVVALLSFSKIELLIKNIFGITSGQGDPALANGKKGLTAGTLFAMGLGKRVLDNGGKLVGGAGRAIGGRIRQSKAQHDLNDYLIGKKDDLPESEDNENGKRTIRGARESVGYLGSGSSDGLSSSDVTQLVKELNQLNRNISKQNTNEDKDKKDNKLKELQEAINSAHKEKLDGLKTMASGAIETVGAAHGLVAGAVIGGALGDNMVQTAISGAGIGDTLGQKAVNMASSTPNVVNNIEVGIKEIKRGARNKDAYDRLSKEMSGSNKNEFDKLQKKLDMYAKQGVSTKGGSGRNSNAISRPKSIDNE